MAGKREFQKVLTTFIRRDVAPGAYLRTVPTEARDYTICPTGAGGNRQLAHFRTETRHGSCSFGDFFLYLTVVPRHTASPLRDDSAQIESVRYKH